MSQLGPEQRSRHGKSAKHSGQRHGHGPQAEGSLPATWSRTRALASPGLSFPLCHVRGRQSASVFPLDTMAHSVWYLVDGHVASPQCGCYDLAPRPRRPRGGQHTGAHVGRRTQRASHPWAVPAGGPMAKLMSSLAG